MSYQISHLGQALAMCQADPFTLKGRQKEVQLSLSGQRALFESSSGLLPPLVPVALLPCQFCTDHVFNILFSLFGCIQQECCLQQLLPEKGSLVVLICISLITN